MDLRELRIGNTIIINYPAAPLFRTIKLYHLNELRNGELTGEPIRLSELWFKKLGFDDLGEYGFGIEYFHIRLHGNEMYFPVNNRRVFIEYVHQLQNLYFALTGKELELK